MPDAPYAIIDASETHLPGIQAIFNQAVRETFSIWSETWPARQEPSTDVPRSQWIEILGHIPALWQVTKLAL